MRLPFLAVLVTLSGCSFFNPPCTRLAKVVCDLPSEGDVCAFVLDRDRNDTDAQDLCEDVLAAAVVFAADRSDTDARANWTDARRQLAEQGFKANALKGQIGEKLKAAGGTAGRMIERVDEAMELDQKLLDARMDGIE